jgi:pentatricopeptide repeat protein
MIIGSVGPSAFPEVEMALQAKSANAASSFENALAAASKDLPSKQGNSENEAVELKKACVQFEAYFFQMMLKEMRKTSLGSGSPAKGREESIFTEMLDDERSKAVAVNGSFGLAEMMFKQMQRQGFSG